MTAISRPCSNKYAAVHHSGTRLPSAIKWIVLHSTEGPTAESAAAYFATEASGGSAHICVDDNWCFRTLNDTTIPWAAPGANENGLHIEQAGYAAWNREQWMKHELTIERAAYRAAGWAKQYGVPLRWVGPVGLRLGRPGFTTHRDVSYAFPMQARAAGFHTDPGSGYPKDVFLNFVRRFSV